MAPITFPIRRIALAALIAAAPAGAPAQVDKVVPPGGQVGDPSAGHATGAAQVGDAGRRALSPDQIGATARRSGEDQIVTERRASQAGLPQVAREARTGGATPQIAPAARNATAPESAANRSDGRTTAIVRLGGSDACGPATAAAQTERCARIIENRAAEYSAARAPTLSPEQRLLLEQTEAEMRGVRGAAQRAARNIIDPNAVETQALAAITLAPAAEPTPAEQAATAEPSALDAIIQIITGVPTVPPNP